MKPLTNNVERIAWAKAQRAKMSAQTQADVDAVLALARTDTKSATKLFRKTAAKRKWPLWVQAALTDTVRALLLEVAS